MPGVDTTDLRAAYRALLLAAEAVAASGEAAPPPGEWNAEQILAHVALINATTLAAVATIAAGGPTVYDNRTALDPWTIRHVTAAAGGAAGLRERIRIQGEALCALVGPAALGDAELDTPVSARLLSHGRLLLDQPMPLRDLLTGLAEVELPGHADQLLALRPSR